MEKEKKTVKIKCINCGGGGIVAVGEICEICMGTGTQTAEIAE